MRESTHSGLFENAQPGIAGMMIPVYAQPHRWTLIIGFGNVLPLLWIRLFKAIQKPVRVQVTCFALRKFSQQLFLLSLELTQYTVDQPFQLRTFNRNGTFHRLSQCGMRGDSGMKKLIKTHHNQIMYGALFAGHWA